MTVSNQSGVAQTDYPMTFARPFVAGEIADYPKALVNGTPVSTQTTVMQRHPDGSVKHAHIAFLLPSLTSGTTPVTLTFANQATGNNTALSQSDMLNAAYDFDCQFECLFPPYKTGNPLNTYATWKAITNGSLAVVVNGVTDEITGIDFSTLPAGSGSDDVDYLSYIQPFIATLTTGKPYWLTSEWIGQYGLHSELWYSVGGTGNTINITTPSTGTDIGPLLFNSSVVTAAGYTVTRSARTMLTNSDYKVWYSGPIAQTIELRDDTTARTYDFGDRADSYLPARPRFYCTFYPASHKVEICWAIENGVTTGLKNLNYYLTVQSGAASPTTINTQDLVYKFPKTAAHWSLTTVVGRTWLGGQPEQQININHNLNYLSASNAFSKFDTTLTIPEPALASKYAQFQAWRNQWFDGNNLGTSSGTPSEQNKGLLFAGMPAGGGREDIGPLPGWHVRWLFTGDHRMREIVYNTADLSSAWPANLRETDTTRKLRRGDVAGTGFGHPCSISSRTTWRGLHMGTTFDITPDDMPVVVGLPWPKAPLRMAAWWQWDTAHMPQYHYAPYMLTGDPFWLQLMYNWTAWAASDANGAAITDAQGRGPTGAEGGAGYNGNFRGGAWIMARRAEAWFAAPDADPEKAWFYELCIDWIASWEGSLHIDGTPLDGHAMKVWQRTYGNRDQNGPWDYRGIPLLHNMECQDDMLDQATFVLQNDSRGNGFWNDGVVGGATSLFMQRYMNYCIGRSLELGLPAGPVFDWAMKFFLDMILISGHPEYIAAFQWPVQDRVSSYFTWATLASDVFTSTFYNSPIIRLPFAGRLLNADDRPMEACGLMAMASTRSSDGAAAWTWFFDNAYTPTKARIPNGDISTIKENPQWAIIPRT